MTVDCISCSTNGFRCATCYGLRPTRNLLFDSGYQDGGLVDMTDKKNTKRNAVTRLSVAKPVH